MTPITDSVAFLSEARTALEEQTLLSDREAQLKAEAARLEKALETEKKTLNDTVSATIKKRREDISGSYDKEIAKGQDKLKKARVKREKARNQGMQDRIAEETADLRDENREIRLRTRTLFQQKRVPSFCNSGWYYTLFMPRFVGEFLRLFIAVLICFLGVPYSIYNFLIPGKKIWMLVLIFFLSTLIFGGLYIIISNKTKLLYMEALKEGRRMRDQLHSNKKKIKVITRSIKRDKDEAVYNLEKYDDEIAQAEQELQEIAAKKKEALGTFEQVTKTIISDEIYNNAKPRLEKLREEYSKAEQDIKEVESQLKDKSIYITDHYGTYLGKEFLDPLKIGELSEFIKNGKASNLSEAMELYKSLKENDK